MCGIVAIIGAYQNGFTQDEQNIFRDMLFVDTLRGWDSTGVFMVTNKGNVHVRKAAVHGPDFIQTDGFKKLKAQSWAEGLFMVGHNRAATRGSVTDQNAHPFVVDNKIVLVQNGTYFGDHKHHKDTEVDSEAVAHVISENADVEQALQKINAAYTLMWYNVETKTLHAIRNTHRPLYKARTADDAILFASEESTIWWACARNNVKLKGTPKMLEPGELHTFRMEGKEYVPEVTKIEHSFRDFSRSTNWPYMGDDEDAYASWARRTFSGRGYYDQPTTPAGKSEVTELNLYDYLHKRNALISYALRDEEVKGIREECESAEKNRKQLIIELEGYLPMEEPSTNCNRWILYGQLVRINKHDPSPMVYTILTNMDEASVMEYVTAGIYTAEVACGNVEHTIWPNTKGSYKVVTQFATTFKLIPTLENVIENQTTH